MVLPTTIRDTGVILQKEWQGLDFHRRLKKACSFSNENRGKSDAINTLSVSVQVFEACVSVFV